MLKIQETVSPATASAAVATMLSDHQEQQEVGFAPAKNAARLVVQSSKDVKFSSKVSANGDDC